MEGEWRVTEREVARKAAPAVRALAERRALLAELYAIRRLELVRLAALLVGDQETAEDVVQDAFAGLSSGGLRDPGKAMHYLRRAVVNNARSALRRRRTARLFVPPRTAPARSAEELAVLSDEHRQVLNALQQLPRRQREVLVLRFWSELTVAETADALGITDGTVKSATSRGLVTLTKRLEGLR